MKIVKETLTLLVLFKGLYVTAAPLRSRSSKNLEDTDYIDRNYELDDDEEKLEMAAVKKDLNIRLDALKEEENIKLKAILDEKKIKMEALDETVMKKTNDIASNGEEEDMTLEKDLDEMMTYETDEEDEENKDNDIIIKQKQVDKKNVEVAKGIDDIDKQLSKAKPQTQSSTLVMNNIALQGTASQSSTWLQASMAIDGIFGGMSHTNPDDENPWWKVDLQRDAEISSIVVWGREDCCTEQLSKSEVVIYNYGVKMAVFSLGDTANVRKFEFEADKIMGNSVVILGGGEGTLNLVEVEVFGRYIPLVENIARLGVASQSSRHYDWYASRAINGNNAGINGGKSMSHTAFGDNNPWWKVDLQRSAEILRIVVWNREGDDGLTKRLSNSRVIVHNYGIKVAEFFIADTTNVRKLEFEANSIVGDSVTILGSQQCLTLAEVEVFGAGQFNLVAF